MALVFTPNPVPTVPVLGAEERFPVHRIYCVGQNYGDHVKEMGGDPKQNPPVFFSKPADAIVIDNAAVQYPPATNNLHHEVELVVALGRGGRNIAVDEAPQCIFGYAVGIDFTRRDLQAEAKQKGKPWDAAKGFDQSAPLSAINPVADVKHPQQGRIALRVNDEVRQEADLSDMIWSVPEIINELSRYFELQAGDLIFTGTPAGVSAVIAGDHLQAEIEAVGEVDFQLVSE
ncbi:MAG TPA: fumarylacetoacetate hydrolase family protein [Gammaproteobacteria bacterium]|jgi:fumarylpyruvate hydrolase|nr:fumarylacetoacetate hydrolase family protein [Gammaproteobacteria bacterium]|tara:strand:+ start:28879 stop:29571 length:693 start_codon:yes stop_codon:yes gene_type:complete